uniref:Uncharacterized protein n=1 Tax=Candidatus Kentrum sp. UNK TaxID=2126344 RepID=A0A451B2R4_9GAMM|nr:MAG: hypothetical protein BECKUNK1418G_GA0071005_11323 [Candidatus Kentron sp. UNK]VFK72588.1 MAG: hypothetical protein BECKUNK1418H_GA0071006_11243 [Candidatus Kentron sp. UNK]
MSKSMSENEREEQKHIAECRAVSDGVHDYLARAHGARYSAPVIEGVLLALYRRYAMDTTNMTLLNLLGRH